MHDKKAFLLSLMDPKPEEIELVQLDLDIGDITLCDVLRNFNTLFPENCRARYEIRDGHKVYAIICKSDYLQPLHAIVRLIGHDPTINCESKNYLILPETYPILGLKFVSRLIPTGTEFTCVKSNIGCFPANAGNETG